jgi:hypothetical protein
VKCWNEKEGKLAHVDRKYETLPALGLAWGEQPSLEQPVRVDRGRRKKGKIESEMRKAKGG